jgi:hypothetical protein
VTASLLRYFPGNPALGFPPPQPPLPPSVRERSPETQALKGLTVEHDPKNKPQRRKSEVIRHSPDQLLRRPVALPGGLVVSAERRNGRILVRVESPDDGR